MKHSFSQGISISLFNTVCYFPFLGRQQNSVFCCCWLLFCCFVGGTCIRHWGTFHRQERHRLDLQCHPSLSMFRKKTKQPLFIAWNIKWSPNRPDCLGNEPWRTACLLRGSRVTTQVLGVAKQGRFQLLYLLIVRRSSAALACRGLRTCRGASVCHPVFLSLFPSFQVDLEKGEGQKEVCHTHSSKAVFSKESPCIPHTGRQASRTLRVF